MFRVCCSLIALVLLCSSCADETPAFDHQLVDINEPRLGNVSTFFSSGDDVWAANNNGAVFHSSNKGDTWNSYKTPLKSKPLKIQFSNSGQSGVLIESTGIVHITQNAGETWNSNNIELVIDHLRFHDEDETDFDIKIGPSIDLIYLRISCNIFSSEDAGETWKKLTEKIRNSISDSCVEHMYVDDNNTLSHVAISVAETPHALLRTNRDLSEFDIICRSSGTPYYQKCATNIAVPARYELLSQDTLAPDEIYAEFYNIQSKLFTIDPEGTSSEIKYTPTKQYFDYFSATGNFTQFGERTWAHFGKFLAYSDDTINWTTVVNKPDNNLGSGYHLIPNADVTTHGNIRYVSSSRFHWGTTYFNAPGQANWHVLFDEQGSSINLLRHSKTEHSLYGITKNRLLKKIDDSSKWIVVYESNWEINGFILVDQRIVLVEELDDTKRLKYSDDKGKTWMTSDAVESKYSTNEFKCTQDQCLLATRTNMIRFLIRKGMGIEVINTPIKYEGSDKHYGRNFIFSKDLNKIWFENGSALIESPENLESNQEWKSIIQESINFHSTLVSPSGEHAFVFLKNGRKLIPVKLINGKWQKLEAIKFPEVNFDNYTHLDNIMCWVDNKRALFYTTDEYQRPLYAVTNDSGNTWQRVSIRTKPSDCWREEDKLLLNSYKLGINQ